MNQPAHLEYQTISNLLILGGLTIFHHESKGTRLRTSTSMTLHPSPAPSTHPLDLHPSATPPAPSQVPCPRSCAQRTGRTLRRGTRRQEREDGASVAARRGGGERSPRPACAQRAQEEGRLDGSGDTEDSFAELLIG